MPKEMRREERVSLLTPTCHGGGSSTTARGSTTNGSHFTTTGESLPSPLSMTFHGHHEDHSRSHSTDNEDNDDDNDSDKDYMDANAFQLDKDDINDNDNNKEEERSRPLVRSPRRHNFHPSEHHSHRDNKRCDDYDNNITDNSIFSSFLSSTRPPNGLKGTSGSRGIVRDNRPTDIDTNADQCHKQRQQATASASYALLLDFGPENLT